MQFTVTQANEASMVTGTKYQFYFTAENTLGEGPASDVVMNALGSLPNAPSAPTLNRASCTPTSLYIEWSALATQDINVDGFGLYMSEATTNSDFKLIFDGYAKHKTLFFNATNLKTGSSYSFYLVEKNFNGYGDTSSQSTWTVWIPPSGVGKLIFNGATSSSITLSWSKPTNNVGCPITGFRLLRSNGDGTTPTIQELVIVQDNPELTSWTTTGLTKIGSEYMFYLIVYNEVGSASSNVFSFVLAAVPDTPTNIVFQDYTSTGVNKIILSFVSLTTAQNGGSSILGYQIWRDNGHGGDFFALYENDSVLSTSYVDYNVTKGISYRYKWRAWNINGWSEFSPVAYLIAASIPQNLKNQSWFLLMMLHSS